MLIDLSHTGPVTLNPSEYPTTLAIRLDSGLVPIGGSRPGCGVFAGKHDFFSRHEVERLVPLIEDDGGGGQTFILDRPERGSQVHMIRRWHYAAIGWDSGVYVEHPYAYAITLEEQNHDAENYFWAVSVLENLLPRFHLILADYEPGALARGVVRAL